MLEKAKARGLYQRLGHADLLETVGRESSATYDLVLAADVLVYLGRLDELAGKVKRLLRPSGIFAFSVEALEAVAASTPAPDGSPDYQLQQTGRYAHSRTYMVRLASEHQFEVGHLAQIQGRVNEGKAVPAYLVLYCARG